MANYKGKFRVDSRFGFRPKEGLHNEKNCKKTDK